MRRVLMAYRCSLFDVGDDKKETKHRTCGVRKKRGIMSKKIILHLCADIGSDSYYFQQDPDYEVVLIGEKIGVENIHNYDKVHGIIANPVCTEFSNAKRFDIPRDHEKGMFLVNHCLRIIKECNPEWWMMENPSTGALKKYIGKPNYIYQPWQYGSPWTEGTGLS